MRIILFFMIIFLSCSGGPSTRAQDAIDGSGESGGVTMQETPQELDRTANNYKYSPASHEPSQQSEKRYLHSIRAWLNKLSPASRERAQEILIEAHPRVHALRTAIREKKIELASLSFDRHTPAETLPRLGQELQVLRDELQSRLNSVKNRLEKEVGVDLGPLGGEGFWLSIPAGNDIFAQPGS